MSGGILDLPCRGILSGCCFRRGVAKAGFTGGIGVGTIEAPRETGKSQVGPLEDIRKSKFTCNAFIIFNFLTNRQAMFFSVNNYHFYMMMMMCQLQSHTSVN